MTTKTTAPRAPALASLEDMRGALRAVGAEEKTAVGMAGAYWTLRGQSAFVPTGSMRGVALIKIRKEVERVLGAPRVSPGADGQPRDWTPMDLFDVSRAEVATWEEIEKLMASGILATRFVKIDQELANRIIATHATHNRDLRPSTVARYASDMRLGRWGVSHQGLAFDQQGRLVDGQHRLYAIDEADVTVWLPVTTNIPPGAQEYVDQGLPRKAIDVIRLAGDKEATGFQMAVARRMLIGVRTQVIISRQEQIEFFRRHRKAVVFTTDVAFQKRRAFYVVQSPIGAVLARAWYHTDRDKLTRFGEVMLEGLSLGAGEKPIILLREWLQAGATREKSAQRIARELVIYMKTQRALVAYLGEEVLSTLYVMKEEAYPLPEEAGPRRSRSKQTLGPGRPPEVS